MTGIGGATVLSIPPDAERVGLAVIVEIDRAMAVSMFEVVGGVVY
jgi:hypothetical protein